MGWGRTLLLGDIGNRLDIEDTERDIIRLRHRIEDEQFTNLSQTEHIVALENENAELKLYLAALYRLLLSKGILSKDEVEAMVNAVDAEDCVEDGRYDGNIV